MYRLCHNFKRGELTICNARSLLTLHTHTHGITHHALNVYRISRWQYPSGHSPPHCQTEFHGIQQQLHTSCSPPSIFLLSPSPLDPSCQNEGMGRPTGIQCSKGSVHCRLLPKEQCDCHWQCRSDCSDMEPISDQVWLIYREWRRA